MMRGDALVDPAVKKYQFLPHGWRLVASRGSTAPAGWSWAHNGLGLFHPKFEFALVRTPGTGAA